MWLLTHIKADVEDLSYPLAQGDVQISGRHADKVGYIAVGNVNTLWYAGCPYIIIRNSQTSSLESHQVVPSCQSQHTRGINDITTHVRGSKIQHFSEVEVVSF